MILSLVLLLFGFALLLFGAGQLVEGAGSIAKRFGVPDIVIGLTIVAFGTSAPELVVNVIAAIKGSSELVLGNVIGSNLFNVLGILGLTAIVTPLTVRTNTTWLEIPLSLLAALLVWVLIRDRYLDGATQDAVSRSEGIVLLSFFLIFLVYNLNLARNSKVPHMDLKEYPLWRSVLYVVAGFAGLIVGGRLIVMNGVSLAQFWGMSERVIALTIVSIGTSLPELATSLVAARRGNVDLAIGNVVGSNIFNIFFILGCSAVLSPVSVAEGSELDVLLNILSGLLLFLFVFIGRGRQLDRWEGILFLAVYAGYMVYVLR